MFVVEITIRHYPYQRIGVNAKEPDAPPAAVWHDRTTWPDDQEGFRRTPAGVLTDAAKHMTTQTLPEPDKSRGER